jgi:flagellar assembly protein FliH
VLHRELTVDRDALTGIVASAMRRLRAQEVIRVRVHPRLEQQLRRALEAAEVADIDLLADPKVGASGLVFETNRGNLEMSVDGQLEEIARGLSDVLTR